MYLVHATIHFKICLVTTFASEHLPGYGQRVARSLELLGATHIMQGL